MGGSILAHGEKTFESYLQDTQYNAIFAALKYYIYKNRQRLNLSTRIVPDPDYPELDDIHVMGVTFKEGEGDCICFRAAVQTDVILRGTGHRDYEEDMVTPWFTVAFSGILHNGLSKAKYDRAQGEKNKAGSEAQKQKGIVETTEEVLAKEIDSLIPEITLEDGTKAAEEQEAMLAEQIEKLDAQITELEKKEKRKNELDAVLPKKEQRLSETEKTLTSVTAEIAALTEKAKSSEFQINALRGKLAFPDKAAAEAEIASLQAEADRLHKNLKAAEMAYNQCKERLAGVRGTIAQLRKQLEDGTDIDAEQLQEEKNGYTAQKSAATAKQKAVHARISANQNALEGISRQATEMEKLDKKYAWMKALSDTANGTVYGKDKMMLETYIQATYFERILVRANIRLQKMSGGQYDLKRRAEADNKKSQSGLELDIIDHINATERSVNTLSGGEAFLASLALALGLSDEVQMSTGIRLDTLFVDEGFGSLDSDALSKAYNTLAGLTEGNRLVGIISHVAELKEKIDKQIVVKKEKTGESRAEMCI